MLFFFLFSFALHRIMFVLQTGHAGNRPIGFSLFDVVCFVFLLMNY
jgi:hypothetical protein